MREIKFRGKAGSGKWKYGIFVNICDECFIIGEGKWISAIGQFDVEYSEVDCKSIGQYTGLKDRNGKGIYEGDIVKFKSMFHSYSDVGLVVWDGNGFYIKGKRDSDVLLHPDDSDFIEVIGNVYESPELLKEVNEDENKNKKRCKNI